MARINATLEHEQAQARSASGGGEPAVPVPSHAEHRAPSGRFVLGMSAAAVILAIAGITGLEALRAPAADSLLATFKAAARPVAETSPTDPTDLRVQVSMTDYTAASLTAQARHLLDASDSAKPPLAGDAPTVGPLGTPLGVAGCLGALRLGDAVPVAVDIARFEGVPAAVVVTVRGEDMEVIVVERSCGGPQSRPLTGPVPLP